MPTWLKPKWNQDSERKHDEPCTCTVRKWLLQISTLGPRSNSSPKWYQEACKIRALVRWRYCCLGAEAQRTRIWQPLQKSPPRGSDLRMAVTPSQFRLMSTLHKTQKHSHLNDDTLFSLSDTYSLAFHSAWSQARIFKPCGFLLSYSVRFFIFILKDIFDTFIQKGCFTLKTDG